MRIFIDTSGFYSILDADDVNHQRASRYWTDAINNGESLATSNYIVVETYAILQRRLGIPVVRRFEEDILPVVSVEWIDKSLHDQGTSAVLVSSKGGPNIVDCVSFALIRALDIESVFTFDKHFANQGFDCGP